MSDDNSILAAGALIWRRNESDQIEIAFVHRVKYDDWSIPKGKLEGDESLIACAYREVMEETGFSVRFGQSLGSISYQVGQRSKSVTYWAAKYLASPGSPNPSEVDEVRWVLASDADSFLTRTLDKEIVKRFLSTDPDSKPLVLLRHAKAIERVEWAGEDTDRPLSSIGERQAKRLISSLAPYGIEEIHSSSAVRCYESITPIARGQNIDFFFTDSLSEDVYKKDKERAAKYVNKLLVNNYSALVCSHNPVLPAILSSFVDKFGIEVTEVKLEPGDAWIVHHVEREVVGIDFLPAPKI